MPARAQRGANNVSIDDDITAWILKLKAGDAQAPQVIWDRYIEALIPKVRRKLEGIPRRAADEEDVAISAMHSFFRGVAGGRFPKLDDRDDLWKVLVTIAARKAVAARRRHFRLKNGGGKVGGESAFFATADAAGSNAGLAQLLGPSPSPDFSAEVAETCERLMARLDDEALRATALLKLESYTNEEIADKLQCTVRSVERRLKRIRDLWSREDTPWPATQNR
jgi:DNA-directed RNA polymerase specialized sigma24 family protein